MRIIYQPESFTATKVSDLINEVPWVSEQARRKECFMSDEPREYQYIENGPIYYSVPFIPAVEYIRIVVNYIYQCRMNVCFLNYYEDQNQALGWHADDAPQIDQTEPIVVVSFGQAREIWWRRKDEKGVVPPEQRQLLEYGSVFVMPPGMQDTHFHRIPKGDRAMGPRVSLTYRCWKGDK